jgi:hypothetical protein
MRMIPSFFITVATAFFAFSPAQAAPQNLLLVAQNDDVEFRCANGRCSAEATAICMQMARATPESGTPYELVEEARFGTGRKEGLVLVGQTKAGLEKTLPLEVLGIVAEREHMAVRFTVSEDVLKQHKVAALRLRMRHSVVLEPVWHEGDAHPQFDEDIAASIGPGRDIAEQVFAFRDDQVTAARVLRDMLNRLPREEVATVTERKAAFDKALKRRAAFRNNTVTRAARTQAREAVESCGYIEDEEMWFRGYHTRVSRFRDCIGQRHDALIKDVNQTYWKAREGAGV